MVITGFDVKGFCVVITGFDVIEVLLVVITGADVKVDVDITDNIEGGDFVICNEGIIPLFVSFISNCSILSK